MLYRVFVQRLPTVRDGFVSIEGKPEKAYKASLFPVGTIAPKPGQSAIQAAKKLAAAPVLAEVWN
jgi:hypothetical protein